ncbi:hypothetical protein QQ045_014741 [Rhodiola kirilowii]
MAFSKSLFLVVVFLACIVPPNFSARVLIENFAESPSKTPLPGGWNFIEDVNDPQVASVAKFAVDEHNIISNDDLIFEKVVIGLDRVVSSIHQYRLIITASRQDVSQRYFTMVQVKSDNLKELMYFRDLD